MSDYFINYAESNIVCIVIFGIMLVRDLFNVDRQEKQIKYDHALVAFMLYFASDTFWAAVVSGIVPKTEVTSALTNGFNYVLMVAVTYTWLNYVMAVEQVPHRNRRLNKIAVLFPFVVATVALVITYVVAPQALFDENLEPTLTYSAFRIAVPDIYIVAILFYSISRAAKEVNPIEKRRQIYIGLFPLTVIAGGLVQILIFPDTSIFCFSCTILMLILYIQSMETQISMDPLTRLNNRGQFTRYISQESNAHKEGLKTFTVMIDINDFKAINDTYGHSEGDKALVIVADSLRKVMQQYTVPSFYGRYGGDEFVLIVHTPDEAEIEKLKAFIREQIKTECKENDTSYDISVGIGYDELIGDNDTFPKCLQRADHKLYLDKEYCKINGNTTVCK